LCLGHQRHPLLSFVARFLNAVRVAALCPTRKSPVGSLTSYQTIPARFGSCTLSVPRAAIQAALLPPAAVEAVSAIQNFLPGARACAVPYTPWNRAAGSSHVRPRTAPKLYELAPVRSTYFLPGKYDAIWLAVDSGTLRA